MQSLRLTLALLLTLAVPLAAAAGVARADACAGHGGSAHTTHIAHHGGMDNMPHGADQAGCDTDCQCPTLHCSAGYALSHANAANNNATHTASLPLMASSDVLPGYTDTPYRPPIQN